MTAKSITGEPRTLEEAHAALRRTRPFGSQAANQWLAYHRWAAQVYEAVSEVDADHHYEALALAGAARETAEALAAEIASAEAR